MRKVRVIKPQGVTISPGTILDLNKKQAARRAFALKDLKKGLYLVEKPVMFKHGEEFGFDGDLGKDLLGNLINMKKAAAEKATK